jgi:hypothetical protein
MKAQCGFAVADVARNVRGEEVVDGIAGAGRDEGAGVLERVAMPRPTPLVPR